MEERGQWRRDPLGRHEWRWYTGSRYTAAVADQGAHGEDPVTGWRSLWLWLRANEGGTIVLAVVVLAGVVTKVQGYW